MGSINDDLRDQRLSFEDFLGDFLRMDTAIRTGMLPRSFFGYWPGAYVDVCEHPMALVKLTDAIATCDGCGRVFELAEFGKGKANGS